MLHTTRKAISNADGHWYLETHFIVFFSALSRHFRSCQDSKIHFKKDNKWDNLKDFSWSLLIRAELSKNKKTKKTTLLVCLIIFKTKDSIQFTAKTSVWRSTFNFSPKQRLKQCLWSNYRDGFHIETVLLSRLHILHILTAFPK